MKTHSGNILSTHGHTDARLTALGDIQEKAQNVHEQAKPPPTRAPVFLLFSLTHAHTHRGEPCVPCVTQSRADPTQQSGACSWPSPAYTYTTFTCFSLYFYSIPTQIIRKNKSLAQGYPTQQSGACSGPSPVYTYTTFTSFFASHIVHTSCSILNTRSYTSCSIWNTTSVPLFYLKMCI